MDLNDIFRKMGGVKTYYTPPTVFGQLINESGGIVLINPPLLPPKHKHFKKMLRIGKLRFYLTWNFRLKNSQDRDQRRDHNGIVKVKERLWEKSGHRCQICGMEIPRFKDSQLHHILSWWRFPQFETDERNLLILCRECHHNIHKDPFIEVSMIKDKCKELGVNIKDYYCYEDNGG